MAPTLWLVRHAPTRDNLDGVIMGRRDPEPDPDGLRAAAGVAPGVTFGLAVASDAVRTARTARAIAPGAPLRLDSRLRERSLGAWEGRAKAAVRAEHPDAFTASGAIRLDAEPRGAESLAQLLQRVHGVLADLAGAEGPVLVVGHNGSLRAALVLLGETDLAVATTLSLEYLRPVVAELRTLRSPHDLGRPDSREEMLTELRAAPGPAGNAPSGAELVHEARAERAARRDARPSSS